jgi:ATP-dependent helicase/DNAse subunit B
MSDAELYMGKKLQLFLYLNAFSSEGDLPSGTYYYKISDGYISDAKQRPALFDGKTVALPEILTASDTLVLDDEKSAVTGLSVKGLSRKTKATTSQEGMLTRMYYAKLLAQKGANYLQDGEFPASPITHDSISACDYCEYGAICKFEKGLTPSRELKSVSAQELDTVLDGDDINE